MNARREVFYKRHGVSPSESGSGHRLYYDDGRLVDRFGRDLERVRSGAAQADRLADLTERLTSAIEAALSSGLVELGQVAGPKLLWRYAYNAYLFDKVASRDNAIARLLELAAEEDARAAEEARGER